MIKTAAVFLILIFSGLTTDCHAASCSELGYTKTSTSGCLGYVLKCPTDESKIFCFTREEIVKKLMPDWSSAQAKHQATATVGCLLTAGFILSRQKASMLLILMSATVTAEA